MSEAKYRLVENGERIQEGDQALSDDCEAWLDISGWEVGMEYKSSIFVPMRRIRAPQAAGK